MATLVSSFWGLLRARQVAAAAAAATTCLTLTLAGCGAALQPGSGAGGAVAALPLSTVRAYSPLLAAGNYVRFASPWKGVWISGRPGQPELQILVNSANDVVGVRGLFPRGVGLQPWFDQARTGAGAGASRAAAASATSPATTGSATVTSGTPAPRTTSSVSSAASGASVASGTAAPSASGPATIGGTATSAAPAGSSSSSSGGAGSAASGSAASGSAASGSAASGGAASTAVPQPSARTAVPLTPGASGAATPAPGANWRAVPPDYTQTIWFVNPAQAANTNAPTDLGNYQQVVAGNPGLNGARRVTGFVPGMGYHYGFMGYGVMLMADRSGRVTGVDAYFPANRGWRRVYDQLPGHLDVVPGLHLAGYSEHAWFVAPTAIR